VLDAVGGFAVLVLAEPKRRNLGADDTEKVKKNIAFHEKYLGEGVVCPGCHAAANEGTDGNRMTLS